MSDQTVDMEHLRRIIANLDDPVELMEQSYVALTQMLRRTDERELLDQLSIMLGEVVGDLPFDAPEKDLRHHTRLAAADCVTILAAASEKRIPRLEHDPVLREQAAARLAEEAPPVDAEDDVRSDDLEYSLPPHLAHLLKHIEYPEPAPPNPRGGFANFDDLCLAALHYRVERVLAFFQKHNPAVSRPLPRPFLLAPAFAEQYKQAITALIYPKIKASRQLRLLASNVDIATATSESFWNQINDSMKRLLELTWNSAWNDLLLMAEQRDGEKVLKIKPETKELREILQPPSAAAYDLPHVGNDEIVLLRSLLSASEDWWPRLSEFWRACHALYEQEWDPRVFQQQAREGALRDMLLKGLTDFPDPWHDFLILLLHQVFPRLSTRYLERFAYNLGQTEQSRRVRMPYLLRYIQQAQACPDIRQQEQRDEEHWHHQVKALANYLKGVSSPTAASAD